MKFEIRRFSLTLLLWFSALDVGRVSAAPPVDSKAPLDPPGSATMPLKPVAAPLPAPLLPAKGPIVAKLGVWVKPDGSVDAVEVLAAPDAWRDSVVAAVKRWRFEPVVWEGQPIPARAEVEVIQVNPKDIQFSLSPLPNLPGELHTEDEFGITNPSLQIDPDLILPLMVRADGRRIEAALSYVIQADGATGKIELLGASSEGAVRSALDLVAERKYRPAKVREQTVAMQYRQVLGFQSLEPREAALKGAVDIVDPVYPYERMLAQEEGSATVRFRLDPTGRVLSTELVEASHPDFGGALIAAVESWAFSAEAATDQNVREYRHAFSLANLPYAARRLIAVQRDGKKISSSPAGLDARPKPIARPALAYPTALYTREISGSARVEFVIDRVGLAQVPRVIEASQPEFGWAAATLVNGMRFDPLTRNGKPAELRVIMPVSFVPPKTAATP